MIYITVIPKVGPYIISVVIIVVNEVVVIKGVKATERVFYMDAFVVKSYNVIRNLI